MYVCVPLFTSVRICALISSFIQAWVYVVTGLTDERTNKSTADGRTDERMHRLFLPTLQMPPIARRDRPTVFFAPYVTPGFANPCPGSPEEVRLCRGPGSSTRNVAIGAFSNPGPPGWADWAPWASVCKQGKQWRTRTCNKPSGGEKVGTCSGPSSESRACEGVRENSGGQGSSSSSPDGGWFNPCDYFSMPALC